MISVNDRLPKKKGYYKTVVECLGTSMTAFLYWGGRKWFFNSHRLPIRVGEVTKWEE